jgi:hypothetical protein
VEMKIEEVLKIRMEMVADEHSPALVILTNTWQEEGQPVEAKRLITVLKRTLDRCKARGITYPRILLKRKGELTRGEFQPATSSMAPVKLTAPSHPKIPQEWIDGATAEFEGKVR